MGRPGVVVTGGSGVSVIYTGVVVTQYGVGVFRNMGVTVVQAGVRVMTAGTGVSA
jgi:hypothetical protein